MATSEQIQAVLDEANFHVDRSEGFVSMALPDAISAAVVVELQRIADALEIMAAQGRHL